MTDTLDLPAKKSFTLVEFADSDDGTPGHVKYYRYTDWNRDYHNVVGATPFFAPPDDLGTFDGGSTKKFYSVPSIEVKLGQNTGVFDAQAYSVTLPAHPLDIRDDLSGDADAAGAKTFVDKATNGEPHSAIKLTIWEVIYDPLVPATPATTPRILKHFIGGVVRTIRNKGGKADNCFFEGFLAKTQLKVALGISVNNQCAWTLGEHKTCKVAIEGPGFAVLCHIAAIDGKEVTILDAGFGPATVDPTGRFWHRGYLAYKGLRIGIRDWKLTAPTKFQLLREPPTSWLLTSDTIVLTAGCDKTIGTCRSRFANEANFGGMGFAIPAWNPLYETP